MGVNLPVFLILVSTLLVPMPFSNGSKHTDDEYKTCSSPSSCGPIKDITYPFWVENTKPGYCGVPLFKLNCNDPTYYPGIWVFWRALSLNTSTHSIIFKLDRNQTCFAVGILSGKNISTFVDTSLIKRGPSVEELTLFLSCPNNTTSLFRTATFPCGSDPDANISVYYLPEEVGSKCQSNVTIWVSKTALDEFNNKKSGTTLESVLEAPMEVNYASLNFTACSECRRSGGVCGSSASFPSTELVCYCPGLGKRNLGLILGIGITGVASVIIAVVVALCYRKNLKFGHSNLILRGLFCNTTTSDLKNGSLYFGVPLFSYKDLAEATNNFSQSRELGHGGFGKVFYGKLKDGREVAVKQLYEKSCKRIKQFMNEVQILTCLRHQNLVSLYGCSSPECSELLLVYEYIHNGTLGDHLHGEKGNSRHLPWFTRMRIAIETASALSYLHASDIIHRDVKTDNLLLDGSFTLKVADFGLSRLFPADTTHVSTAPQGTPGYVDPEYYQCYQLTAKSDVYSFGVVLIELISSLPAVDMNRQRKEINLSNYAMNRIQQCAYGELVDPKLGFGSDFRIRKMVISVAELAIQCLQHEKEFRPTMDEVLEVLKMIESTSNSEELEVGEEVRNHTNTVTPSPTDEGEDDGVRLLMIGMHHHHHHQQQQLNVPSPSSVMDKWGSRSTLASSTSKQSSNLFYSMSY